MSYTYINPWAKEGQPNVYTRHAPPFWTGSGCEIYKVSDKQFDLVKNGVCLAQRCGYNWLTVLALHVDLNDVNDYKQLRELDYSLKESFTDKPAIQTSLFA